MKPALKRFAKRAGAVAIAVIVLDLVATAATAAIGWEFLRR
jgi:hypothetical protein